MEDLTSLIDRIIEEHRQILGNLQGLTTVANDVGAMVKMHSASGEIAPGRLEDQKRSLQKLKNHPAAACPERSLTPEERWLWVRHSVFNFSHT